MYQSNAHFFSRENERGSGIAYPFPAPVLHAVMGASADMMRAQLQPPTLPNYWSLYTVNRGFAQVASLVACQNNHTVPLASFPNDESFNPMGMQLQEGGNIGRNNVRLPLSWPNSVDRLNSEIVQGLIAGQDGDHSSTTNATVQPASNTTNFDTDDVCTQGVASRAFNDCRGDNLSQAFNPSGNMINGQVMPRNEGDLTSRPPCSSPFHVPLTPIFPSGQAIGSGMAKPALINAEQKAQQTQPRLRGGGKDHKGTGTFSCKGCNRNFRGPYELNRHLNHTEKHGGRKVKCPQCGRLLSRRDALEKHKSNPRACRIKL